MVTITQCSSLTGYHYTVQCCSWLPSFRRILLRLPSVQKKITP